MKKQIANQKSLKEVAKEFFPDSSSTQILQWIRAGRFSVDGSCCKDTHILLHRGQTVEVSTRPRFLSHDLKVLFEDDHLIVLEKPEGILSVDIETKGSISVHTILKRRYHNRRVFPVHRLDKETSGVMVFAYTQKAQGHFKELFFKHDIQREYLGIVQGTLAEPSGTWESYIKEDASLFMRPVASHVPGALRAVTHFEVIKTRKQYSLLRFRLETGRKNQIRVHCALAGHPIAGDKKYGVKNRFLSRMFLHAHMLGFKHPEDGRFLSFTASIPQDFSKLV